GRQGAGQPEEEGREGQALSLERTKSSWALGLLPLLVYLPIILHGGWLIDDDNFITQNPLLHASDGLSRIWFSAASPHYYPLLLSIFRLETWLWGASPAGFHLVNALFHGLNALLAWRVLKRLGFTWAWWAAALWALHPVQAESVAWATEGKNIFSGFFGLA